jgi:hypothetical protein
MVQANVSQKSMMYFKKFSGFLYSQLQFFFFNTFSKTMERCTYKIPLFFIFSARNFFNTFREDHEMMHLRDIQKLEGVLSPTHLKVCFCVKYYIIL